MAWRAAGEVMILEEPRRAGWCAQQLNGAGSSSRLPKHAGVVDGSIIKLAEKV